MTRRTFLFSFYMAFIGGNWIAYHLILPVRIAHHILLTTFLIWWLLKHGLPDTPMLVSLFAMVCALMLSGFNAIDRRMALEFAWHWITNWLLFLYLIDELRAGFGDELFTSQVIIGIVLAISCIVSWLLGDPRPAGLFGVVNLAGAYLAALIVPALGMYLTGEKYIRRLALAFLILGSFGILLNQSRGPVISVIVALAVFSFLRMKAHTLLRLSLGMGLMGLLAVSVVGLSVQPRHNDGDVIRLDLWKAGENMLLERPTGVGVGLFAQGYHLTTTSTDQWTGAHNYYINLGAEFGAFGLASGAVMLLVGMYFLLEQKRTIRGDAVLAAFVGALAHLLFDNYPAQNWTFLLSLYAAYLVSDSELLKARIPGTINRLVIYGLAVYGLMFAVWDVAQIHYENGLRLKDRGELAQALALDSHNRLYKLELDSLSNPSIVISSDYAITNFGRISYRHE